MVADLPNTLARAFLVRYRCVYLCREYTFRPLLSSYHEWRKGVRQNSVFLKLGFPVPPELADAKALYFPHPSVPQQCRYTDAQILRSFPRGENWIILDSQHR